MDRQTWTRLLLAKLPTYDPTWSQRIKDRWFDVLRRLKELGEEDA